MGLARTLPDLHRARSRFALHPPADEGVADLPAHQGHRRCVHKAAEGSVHAVAQPEAGADFAVRRHGRTGRGLVHGPVLRALLSADDPQGEQHVGELHRRHRAPAGDAAVRPVRRAVGSHRPQEDHDGRLPGRGALVSADLQGHAGRRGIERRDGRVAAQSRNRSRQPDATDDRGRDDAAGGRGAAVRRSCGRSCRTAPRGS